LILIDNWALARTHDLTCLLSVTSTSRQTPEGRSSLVHRPRRANTVAAQPHLAKGF